MRHYRKVSHATVFLMLGLLSAVATVLGQAGGQYDLSWWTVDGGGGESTGGSYAMAGTIGQPDASALAGDPYTLAGGFWPGGASTPPIATIDLIYPDSVTQGSDLVYFRGTGRDTDEGGRDIVACVWISSIDGQLSDQEDFAIPALDLSTGTHTITFRVQDDEGVWSQEAIGTLTVYPRDYDVRTLIVANRQRLEQLYGASEADQVMSKLNALAFHDSVEGLVLQVENDADVAAAYALWDSDPTWTAQANAVTEAIKRLIDAQWANHPDLEYLVIVGDDRVVPFRRVASQVWVPVKRYVELGNVSRFSTVGAALYDNMTLTDDYYADKEPTVPSSDWDGHDLYIPDLGTGRLIETPDEIIAQIDTFLAGEEATAEDAIVVGYDFVTYGAQNVCGELTRDAIPTDCTLIGEQWRHKDFIARVLDIRHDVVSHFGHAGHGGFGTPPSDNGDPEYPGLVVSSGDIAGATAEHTRVLVYSLGCMSGLNVPPSNPKEPLDLAQALVQHQANYIANTSYGWGGSSEELMLKFTERLVFGQSAALGRALAAAKQEYYRNQWYFDYQDEAAMIEFTLYGLPMVRYITPVVTSAMKQEAGVVKEQQATMPNDGLTVNSVSYQFPPLTTESTADGVYYTLGGLAEADHGQPIQPKYSLDISFPGAKAHGVVFRGGVYTDVSSFDPVVFQAINEYVSPAEPSFDAPGWYPTLLPNLNSLERGQTLVTLLGQFDPSSQTERIYEQQSFDIYYHSDSDDWTEPAITRVESTLSADTAAVTAWADDPSGILAVVVAYTDGDGTWSSAELAQHEDTWTGDFPADAETQFYVQAVDGSGNVAAIEGNGLYFRPGDEFTAWSDDCTLQRMEVTGTGMGDWHHTVSPQTLLLADPDSVKWLLAQVVGRSTPVPDSVAFTTDAPQSLTMTGPSSSSPHGYTFEANLQPTSQITASVNHPGDSYKTPRGLILYSKQAMPDQWTSVGKTTNRYVYHGYHTEVLAFPPLAAATDLYVTAVVIDNDDDSRKMVLEAMAGGVTESVTELGPTDGAGLNIVNLTLSQVPVGTSQVNVTLRSPSQDGDSLVLVGLNVSYPCAGALLHVVPDPATISVGATALLTVTVTPGSAEVNGVQVHGRVDPAYLHLLDVRPSGVLTVEITPPGFEPATGVFSYSAGLLGSVLTEPFPVLVLEVQALEVTDGTWVEFLDDFPPSDVSGPEGSVLSRAQDGLVVVTPPPTLRGAVDMQGRPPRPAPPWAIPLTVWLTPSSIGTPTHTFTTTTDQNGTFGLYLDGVVPGLYDVRVKGNHTLRNLAPGVSLVSGDNIYSLGRLLEGDVETAATFNQVRQEDADALIGSFNRCEGNPGFVANADLDESGCVLLPDFGLLSGNFGKVGDIVITPTTSLQSGLHQISGGSALMAFNVHEMTVAVDQVVNLTLELDPRGQPVNGGMVHLRFDPALVEVLDVTLTDRLPFVLEEPLVDNQQGIVRFAAGVLGRTITDKFSIATLSLRVKADTAGTAINLVDILPAANVSGPRGSVLAEMRGITLRTGSQAGDEYAIYLPIIMK